ncbi:hypothetical protein [Streptomyces sp. NPDC058254]|uniref:hypothetical protein n=1 Tax=Streptomyces sp. NPDC058254 TaxID=3346406 RepID=UPI0036E3D35C
MLRQQWLAKGWVDVPPEVIGPDLWEDVAQEAMTCEPHAVVRHNRRPGLLAMRDGSITSPQRCKVHPGAKAVRALAQSKGLADVAAEATGARKMTAIRMGLKYYAPGDYMYVHRDDGKCEITFSCGLTEGLGPMGWLPDLRWLTTDQTVGRLAGTPYSTWGEEFEIRHRALRGFDGSRVPHWRTPLDTQSAREVLLTICFTDLTV